MHHSRHNSKRHHQQSFGSRIDLTTYPYSVFDAEFEKYVFFEENDTFRVFRIFRRKGSIQ